MRAQTKPKGTFHPRLECLEDRSLPAVALSLTGMQAIIGGFNFNASNEPNSGQSEMSVDINPTNPLNIAGFSHDLGSNANEIDVFFTTNGGTGWTVNTIDTNDDGQVVGTRFDPTIAFDPAGNLFVAYGVDIGASTRLIVARSQDGGTTFNQFTTVDTQAEIGSTVGVDKWHLATGTGVVYIAYTQNVTEGASTDQRIVVRGSNNTGTTFTAATIINDASVAGTDSSNLFADPAVGPNGQLYVSWHDINAGTILLDRDLDGLFNATNDFGTDVVVRTPVESIFKHLVPAQPQRGIHTGPVLDVDRSPGPNNGRLYLTFVDRATSASDPDYDIYLVNSGDQGATWSNAGTGRGNVEPSTGSEFLPWVDVDQRTGAVNVLYYTSDGDQTGGNNDVLARLATSIDGGTTFVRGNLSTTQSNETGGYAGDYLEYIGLAVHDGTAQGFWADNVHTSPGSDLEAFTASASFNSASGGNALTVTGDDAGATNDTIIVRCSILNGNFVEVMMNGVRQFAGLLGTIDTITVNGLNGNDSITIDANITVPVTINGGIGDDTLKGGGGADSLVGGDGTDSLDGGTGNDTLSGAAGNDTLAGGADTDMVIESGGGFTLSNATLIGSGTSTTGTDQLFSQIEQASLTGGTGGDTITAGDITAGIFSGPVTLLGLAGADSLVGGSGNDSLGGGTEADTLYGGLGNDSLVGEAGNDTLYGFNGFDTLAGGDGDDSLDGGVNADWILGGADNDFLRGQKGVDTLDGGTGHDTLFGNEGKDSLVGGDGNDTLNGGIGSDTLDGGAGTNRLVWSDNLTVEINTTLTMPTTGNGTLATVLTDNTPQFTDTLIGGTFQDAMLTGGSTNNRIDASGFTAGPVTLFGGDGNDSLLGTAFVDSLDGGNGIDTLDGANGDDTLSGGADADTIFGLDGNDSLLGGSGMDCLVGGNGNDTLVAGSENDILRGGTGDDSLMGEDGDDNLSGGANNPAPPGGDTLSGGNGSNDTCVGAEFDDLTCEFH